MSTDQEMNTMLREFLPQVISQLNSLSDRQDQYKQQIKAISETTDIRLNNDFIDLKNNVHKSEDEINNLKSSIEKIGYQLDGFKVLLETKMEYMNKTLEETKSSGEKTKDELKTFMIQVSGPIAIGGVIASIVIPMIMK